MKSLLSAVVLMAALPAASATTQAFDATLEPGKIHEECTRLAAGETRKWHWKSDQAVDFNIHYHVGDKVEYPVKRPGMRGDGGTFKATVDQDYCWMWTARKARTRVSGTIE